MKKNLLYLLALVCSLTLFAACSSDDDDSDNKNNENPPEEGYAVLHLFSVVEGEYHTGNPLHKHSEEEGDGYGYEDCHDDGKGFVGVDEVAQREGVAVVHFDEREGEGSSK